MPQQVLKGKYFATVYGPDGSVKSAVEGPNVVCTNGKEFLASFLSSAAAGAATFTQRYIGVGTAVTAEDAADTTLGTEIARQTGTASYLSGNIYQVTATFATNSAVGAVTEYGVFSSNTAGTMLSRDVEAAVNVGVSDTLKVVWQLTLS